MDDTYPQISAKSEPYTIQFVTDNIETMVEALADATAGAKLGSGFQLAYFMSSNGCWWINYIFTYVLIISNRIALTKYYGLLNL